MKSTTVHYIASARCFEAILKPPDIVAGQRGSVLTQDDTLVWLGEQAGYPESSTQKSWAKKFATEQAARGYFKVVDGKPWFRKLKPGSVKIYKIVHTEEWTEEEVQDAVEHSRPITERHRRNTLEKD